MSSPLCSAVARCHLRRLRGRAQGNPLAALVAVAVALVAPVACVRLGSALGAELKGSLAANGVASAILAGPALAGAVAGSALAVSLPGRSALGGQIAAAPFPARDAVVAACLVPVLGGGLLVLVPLGALTTALAAGLERGSATGVALAVAALAAVPAGALVAEGALAASRGAWRQVWLLAGGVATWALLGWKLGDPELGPLAATASAFRGDGSGRRACAIELATLLVLGCGWIAIAARRPDRGARSGRSATRLVRPRGAVPSTVIALPVRRADVRLASIGALVFGLGGALLATVADAPSPAAFMLGTTTALLGSVVPALAAFGIVRDGRWLWLSAPRATAATARVMWAVAVLLTSGPVIAVGAAALAFSSASRSAVGTVVVVVLVAADTAVIAGVLLPWREGAGDQLATFAAFGALAIATSLAVGLVAPRLVSAGVADAAIALGLCCLSAASAVIAVSNGLAGART